MPALSYCIDCDTTVDVDEHFEDDGSCSIQDVREVLEEFSDKSK